MKTRHLMFPFLFVFLVLSGYAHAQTPVDEARKLIDAQNYDAAIPILEKYVAANPNSADGELWLAKSYHWKKDFPKAKGHYLKAGILNPAYRLEIIPALDEKVDSAEIILIAGPEVKPNVTLPPSILGPLATSYRIAGRPADVKRIRDILKATQYGDAYLEDYKKYVLAYSALWDGDIPQAKSWLKQIKSKPMLQYARTHDKFEVLYSDKEFLELTK